MVRVGVISNLLPTDGANEVIRCSHDYDTKFRLGRTFVNQIRFSNVYQMALVISSLFQMAKGVEASGPKALILPLENFE